MKQYLIAGGIALASLAGAFAYGVHKGTVWQVQRFEDDRIQLQDEILELNGTLQERAAKITHLQRENEGLINDLENEARTAEGSSGPGIATTGGLQRLESRWGPRPTSSD